MPLNKSNATTNEKEPRKTIVCTSTRLARHAMGTKPAQSSNIINSVAPSDHLSASVDKPQLIPKMSERLSSRSDDHLNAKIDEFQQNPELVDIMEIFLERNKERYLLPLAQLGAKL